MAEVFSQLLSLTKVLGGLALFLFGMKEMSGGLQTAAGKGLRGFLQAATRRRLSGMGLGTALGFLVHSSGATVLLVGFLNAGLISLTQSLPVIFGANLGTTLSMQAVSFKLTDFSYLAIGLGFGSRFLKGNKVKAIGQALFGFGLLFLGMEIMSQGVFPYRETLRPVLTRLDGNTATGMLAGIVVALAVTAVIQSSGATIGMAFAFIHAEIFTSLSQTMPIILGAHIGTCATALLASMGAQVPARRAALAHLLFNITNVILSILFRDPLIQFLEGTSTDLVRQTANLHTAAMVLGIGLLLPLTQPFTRLIERMLPERGTPPEASHLEPELMDHVETALPAVRREFVRLLRLTRESIELNRRLLESSQEEAVKRIRMIENIIDSIKSTMIGNLRQLARQTEDVTQLPDIDQWIRCMVEVERIGDHLNLLRKLSQERNSEPGHILFGRELTHRLNQLFQQTEVLLEQLGDHFLAEADDFYEQVDNILRGRVALLDATMQARELLVSRIKEARLPPEAMFYLSSYLEVFERMARHAQILASTSPAPGGDEPLTAAIPR